MRWLAVMFSLILPMTGLATDFELEGYDREVNDGTVIRESAGMDDIVAVRLHCCRTSDS